MGTQARKRFWRGLRFSSPLWAAGSSGWEASQLCLCVLLFIVELVASRATGSLLLLACSFHTLGGALVLGVALTKVWLSTGGCPSRTNTFGWARTQVAGTLVSTVFLSALGLALVPEAVRRTAAPRVTEHPLVLMGIGAVGIPIHLVRAGLLEKQHHDPVPRPCCSRKRLAQVGSNAQETEDLLRNKSSRNRQPWIEYWYASFMSPEKKPGLRQTRYLSWMVACLGPLVVLLYSLTFHSLWPPCVGHTACLNLCTRILCWAGNASESLQHEPTPCWLLYLDPGLSVALATALLCLVWPALRGSALLLLQAVPDDFDLQVLELHLQATEGVAAVRELHVWQLDGPGSLVATVQVSCFDVAAYEAVMERVQQVFCEHNIHAATVQPDLGACRSRKCHERCRESLCMRLLAPDQEVIVEYETTI